MFELLLNSIKKRKKLNEFQFVSQIWNISIITALVLPQIKKNKYKVFNYFIECPTFINEKNIREKVCQKAFLNFLGLNKSELRKKIQIDRKNLKDNRGTHENRL